MNQPPKNQRWLPQSSCFYKMNELRTSQTTPFSMVEVAKEAILFICTNHREVLYTIKYPFALTLILSIFIHPDPHNINLRWALSYVVQTYLYILIVVKLHRLFLIDESDHSLKESLKWQKNNTSYLFTSLAIALIAAIVAIPFTFIVPFFIDISDDTTSIFIFLILFPAGYIASRISLVLPSIAINDLIDFSESWNISKGYGWKVFFLVTILPVSFSYVNDIIYKDFIALRPIYSLIGLIMLSVEVIILSNTYKNLLNIHKLSLKHNISLE